MFFVPFGGTLAYDELQIDKDEQIQLNERTTLQFIGVSYSI